MSKNKRLSRDQKRKQKLSKRSPHSSHGDLAYAGQKYRVDELIPLYQETEMAILEVYVMTRRALADATVRSAVENLVLQMRQGPLPPQLEQEQLGPVQGNEEAWIIWNIRRHWGFLNEKDQHFSADQRLGVLRTTLHSLEVWGSPSPRSRGYLRYIEGFLKKQGIRAEMVPVEEGALPEPEVPELLEIGREWLRTDNREAASDFQDLAEEMLHEGQVETVAQVCDNLRDLVQLGRHAEILDAIAQKTRDAME